MACEAATEAEALAMREPQAHDDRASIQLLYAEGLH